MALEKQNNADQTLDAATPPGNSPARASIDPQSQTTLDGNSAPATVGPCIPTSRSAIIVPEIDGYEITGRLGEGGMGVVWKATQHGTHRPVALKLMSAASFGSERARLRFQREVDLTARLEHPHIARVYDGGENRGICYYAMEFIDGVPVDQHIRERKFSRPQILELMKTICEAVQYAHQKGVIHRDLKPANILVDKEGKPRVLDFGLAKALSDDDGQMLSMDMGAAGTPAYMSPEQAAGHLDQVDTRSDVYTLGVILFYLLSGKYPHDIRGSALEVMKRISEQEPCRLKDIEPRADRDLEALLTKALAREPERRYGTAGDLAADLARYLNGEPVIAQPPTIKYLLGKRLRKNRVPLGIAAGVCVILLGMAAWSYVKVTKERNAAQAAKDVALAANTEKEHQRQEAEDQRNEAVRQRTMAQQKTVEADRERQIAVAQQRRAELRTAEGLLTEGNALGLANRWGDARTVYEEASDSFHNLDVPLLPVNAGLAKSYARSPVALLTLAGHEFRVYCALACPDGSTAATGSADKTIRIWDLKTGRLLRTLRGHDSTISALDVSPDQRYLLSGSRDKTLKLWDLQSGKELKTLSGHTGEVLSVAISRDGRIAISGGSDHVMRVWDLESGTQLWASPDQTKSVNFVCFMPDGKTLVSVAAWHFTQWDLATRQALTTLDQKNGYTINLLRVSTDAQRIVMAGIYSRVYVLDAMGKQISTLSGHAAAVYGLALSSNRKIAVSGSEDHVIKVWDLDEERERWTFNGHSGPVRGISLTPDDRMVVSGSFDKTVKLWNLKDTQDVRIVKGTGSQPTAVAISPDERTALSAYTDGSLLLLDLATGRTVIHLRFANGHADDVAFLPNGKFALTSDGEQKTLTLWDLTTGQIVHVMSGHDAAVRHVAGSPDGSTAVSCGLDRTVKWWDLAGGKLIRTLGTHKSYVAGVTFSADGKRVVSVGEDQELKIWDLKEGPSRTVKIPAVQPGGVAFCPDERHFVMETMDNALGKFDMESGVVVRTYIGHSNRTFPNSVAISADGRFLISGSEDRTLKLWDVQTGKELQSYEHPSSVHCAALSPDAHWALCGVWEPNRHSVEIWDWTRPAMYREMQAPVHHAQAALQSNPDDPAALAVLGRWWAFRGINDWAVELLEKARAGGAEVSPLLLGRCYWQIDRFAEARQEFKKAMSQAKDEPARYYLELCMGALDRAQGPAKN